MMEIFRYVLNVEIQKFVGYVLLYIFLENLITITNKLSIHTIFP